MSEGEIQEQNIENFPYTESFIYPLVQVEYIKSWGVKKEKNE